MYRFPALYSEFQNVEGGKRKGERRWRSPFSAESGADVSVAGNRSLSCGFHKIAHQDIDKQFPG